MPSGTAAWIVRIPHNVTDVVQILDVLDMLPERKFDIALLQHGVDAAQPVRLGIGHRLEPPQRILEIRYRLAVGPPALRLFRGENGVIDALFRLIAAAEMKGQSVGDLPNTVLEKRFGRRADRRMQQAAVALEQAGIGGFLS